jgi:hypothetical protein
MQAELMIPAVVRSSGERTRDALLYSLKQMPFINRVVNIDGLSFEECLEEIYNWGCYLNAPFFVTLDADLLTTESALLRFIKLSNDMICTDTRVATTYGLCFDNYSSDYRAVGIRLYRSALMPVILEEFLSVVKGKGFLRPEAETMRSIMHKGYKTAEVPVVCGLHGFGQHERDIYRTLKLQMRKNPSALARWTLDWRCKRNSELELRFFISCALSIKLASLIPLLTHKCEKELAAGKTREPLTINSIEYKKYEDLMGRHSYINTPRSSVAHLAACGLRLSPISFVINRAKEIRTRLYFLMLSISIGLYKIITGKSLK